MRIVITDNAPGEPAGRVIVRMEDVSEEDAIAHVKTALSVLRKRNDQSPAADRDLIEIASDVWEDLVQEWKRATGPVKDPCMHCGGAHHSMVCPNRQVRRKHAPGVRARGRCESCRADDGHACLPMRNLAPPP